MRRLRFIPALLVILLSACNEKLIENYPVDSTQTGEVMISLSSNIRTNTKADGEDGIDTDNFWVEIFNSKKIRLFCQQYSSAKDSVIRLNAGDYRLLAKLGDSLGVGFDKPFYMADTLFTVHGQTMETITAEATLANVKTAVVFGENLKKYYTEGYYAIVRHNTLKNKSVKFASDETRPGYIPAGELVFELYAKIDGTWKYYAAEPMEYSPRDFVTFSVDTGIREGWLTLSILIDDEEEEVLKEIEIPSSAASALPPAIVAPSFDENMCWYVTEGIAEDVDNVSFSYSAQAGIASCVLDVDSDYLLSAGVPSTFDFCSLDSSVASALENAGFFWASDNTDGVVDLSRVIPAIGQNAVYVSQDAVAASFTLTVTDVNGHSDSQTVYIKVKPDVSVKVNIPDYDVWARRIVEPHLDVLKANDPSLLSLQYSADGASWTAVGGSASAGFETVTGLNPATSYQFRAVYDGWYPASEVLTVKTEEAAQVGNAGFEEWTEQTHTYEKKLIISYGTENVSWYQPWLSESDAWWDTNSTSTLVESTTPAYNYFKCLPTTTYSVDVDINSGAYCAQIAVINIGGGNSIAPGAGTNGTWYVGELFIGRGNDSHSDWKHVTDGHSFASRPSAIKFKYKFSTNASNDYFGVEAYLSAADGSVLAHNNITDGGTADSWTEMTIPLTYEVTNKCASTIYMSFKASSTGNHSCDVGGSYMEIAGKQGEGDNYRVKLSSLLKIDDIELIYE